MTTTLDASTAAYIRRLENRVAVVESMASQMKVQGGLPASLPGQYPGKPIPSIEGVEITVPAAITMQQGNIVLAADGPFMARAIHFAYRPTAGANTGFWRPIAHSISLEIAGAVATNVIDFYWEYQVTGSHRNRQNIPVPSALCERADNGRGFFEFLTEDTMEASSTIVVRINPTIAPANAGVLYVGFSGVYVLK